MPQISRVKSLVGQPVIVQLQDGSRIGGPLTFAGQNSFLGCHQIAIDRTPIRKDQFKWKDVHPHPAWNDISIARIDYVKLFL